MNNQFSFDEGIKLKAEIEKISFEKNVDASDELESIIANGPVMGDEKIKGV
ncbi:hypothetical protein [Cyclobacterium jeungdonense]|uniref:Uncharacterized protein n=1 Tax=Cyclobacterium jeungdonense TaxID=708087 RepID=A0ABT8C9R2_9BACT|nr:hypothetical protein [Cyclobacterium jeungdonense]MDN3688563.1 hypothetical protein [Cyclobacterium jeungdonense]